MLKRIFFSSIIILIIICSGYSIYWLFRAKALEKETILFLNSYGKTSTKNVSVSGFPLQNILTIEGLKVVLSNDSKSQTLNPIFAVFEESNYKLEVATIRFSNKLFTSNILIENIGDIKIQNGNQSPYLLKFNQSPIINLVFDRNLFTKIDYRDKGYSIFDEQNNEIIKIDGSSTLISNLIEKDNKFYGKINISSNSIASGNFNFLPEFIDKKEQNLKFSSNSKPTKQELSAEIEYVLFLQEKSKNEPSHQTSKFKIESVNIKNVDIINQNNKINVKGNFNKNSSENIYDFTVNFENFDNLINDMRRIYKEMKDTNENNPETLTINTKSKVDIIDPTVDFIFYIASQNPASTNKNATFSFRKDNKSKIMSINGIQLDQIIMQFFMTISKTKPHQNVVIQQNK